MSNDEVKGFSWNPFMEIIDEEHAEAVAGNGIWVGILLAVSYLLAIGLSYLGMDGVLTGADGPSGPGDPPDRTIVYVIDGVAIALALGLAWCVHAFKPRWASIVLLLWVAVELLFKILDAVSGHGFPRGLIVIAAAIIGSILAVRGAFALAEMRKRGVKNPAEVF